MWIKTQNKEALVNCNNFSIQKDEKRKSWIVLCGDSSSNGYIGGKYSSKENALKVIHLIQACLLRTFSGNNKVFQFPQNDEL